MLAPSIRLYSRQRRAPVDVVAVEHLEVHEQLEAWARSGRERRKAATCASVEKAYLRGGRDATPASTAPAPVNGVHARIEAIVVSLERERPRTLTGYYIRKLPVWLICRQIGLGCQAEAETGAGSVFVHRSRTRRRRGGPHGG
jgi:hypothetical protein